MKTLKYIWGLSKTTNIFQTSCHMNISLYKDIPYFSLICKIPWWIYKNAKKLGHLDVSLITKYIKRIYDN